MHTLPYNSRMDSKLVLSGWGNGPFMDNCINHVLLKCSFANGLLIFAIAALLTCV
jgi:hypothetical protein